MQRSVVSGIRPCSRVLCVNVMHLEPLYARHAGGRIGRGCARPAYLEMHPHVAPYTVDGGRELLCGHLGQLVVIDQRPRARGLTAQDVAAGGVAQPVTVNASREIHHGKRAKRVSNPLRPWRVGSR